MIVRETICKHCITKSKLTDYVINPYTGCLHGCRYCYADFIRKFQNIEEEWGSFVYAKVNAPELIVRELEKNKPGHIFISSVTDSYHQPETKFGITRSILERIAESRFKNKFTYEILTKSTLIKRDFYLIKEINAEIGFSVNTLDEDTAKKIEPYASLPKARIEALKEAMEQNITVYGFISPVLPGITDLEELFCELRFCNYVWVELLNTKRYILEKFIPFIKKCFPDKMQYFEFAIRHPDEYFETVRNKVLMLEKKYNLRVNQIVRHQ